MILFDTGFAGRRVTSGDAQLSELDRGHCYELEEHGLLGAGSEK